MPTPNFADKTIWTGDNLDIMRGMNSESVDLIYLDPPFNSNRNYAAPVGSAAAGAAFKEFTFRILEVDHVIPQSRGDTTTSRTCNCSAPAATASRETGTWST